MIRKVAEEHHHSEDEIRLYVSAALAILDEVRVPDDLRTVAFSKVVELLSAKQIWHEQVQPTMAIPGQRLHG